MSVEKNNQTYKKTSFLTGVNSDYIEEYYALYLQNPKLLTKDWIAFFDGLKEDSENIIQNINGPSWSPKKIKKIEEETLQTFSWLYLAVKLKIQKKYFKKQCRRKITQIT